MSSGSTEAKGLTLTTHSGRAAMLLAMFLVMTAPSFAIVLPLSLTTASVRVRPSRSG